MALLIFGAEKFFDIVVRTGHIPPPDACVLVATVRALKYHGGVKRKELNEEKKDLNILAKMEKTLLEYAATEANRNRMSKFLDGITPEEFFFIGFTNHYEEDLAVLARLLNWENYSLIKHNITGEKPDVDASTLEQIKALNEADYDIYNRALKIREERIKSSI